MVEGVQLTRSLGSSYGIAQLLLALNNLRRVALEWLGPRPEAWEEFRIDLLESVKSGSCEGLDKRVQVEIVYRGVALEK